MTSISISVDRGGSFTDIMAEFNATDGSRQRKVMKLLSVNPQSYSDAATEGIRRLLEDITGVEYPQGKSIPSSAPLVRIRLGTTVATNALLERKGCDVVFLTTEGLEDVVSIGTQSRPNIFALDIVKPTPLYSSIISVPERVIVIPNTDTYNTVEGHHGAFPRAQVIESTTTLEQVVILKPLDTTKIQSQLELAYKNNPNSSIAVALAHSYAYPDHEIAIKKIATKIGFKHVSISSELTTTVKLLARAHTTTADAYLTPILKEYIDGFLLGFDKELLKRLDVKFMRSDGTLTDRDHFFGHCSLLSGPAGGYLGFSSTAYVSNDDCDDEKHHHNDDNDDGLDKDGGNNNDAEATSNADNTTTANGKSIELIKIANNLNKVEILDQIPELVELLGHNIAVGCDIGGTSSDCAVFEGRPDVIFRSIISNVEVISPTLNITTLASGGGSILEFQNGLFNVGPHSAGAYPGPSCYNQVPTAPLAITDANCITGKINSQYFPAIFGPTQKEPLSKEAAMNKFAKLTENVNQWRLEQYENNKNNNNNDDGNNNNHEPPTPLTIEDVALGFLAVSYEQIGRGVRSLTESRGLDPRATTLAMFGGAGAQSCCGVADNLGVTTVHIHNLSSILSAYGIHSASVVDEEQTTLNMYLNDSCNRLTELNNSLSEMTKNKLIEMGKKTGGDNNKNIILSTASFINLKYETTDTPLMVELDNNIINGLASSNIDENQIAIGKIEELFFEQYRIEFGFLLERKLIVESIRVRCEANDPLLSLTYPERTKSIPQPKDHLRLFLGTKEHPSEGKWYENVPLYDRGSVEAGVVIPGPCYLIDTTTTIIVEPSWAAFVLWDSVVLLKQGQDLVYSEDNKHHSEENDGKINLMNNQKSEQLGHESDEELTIFTLSDAQRENPCDPILLSLYQNRFASITDQMCRILRRTSCSPNIKERLDFSCAIFTGNGDLVTAGPNLPVHLGSLSTAVVKQIEYQQINNIPWVDGDVLVTNDPRLGGSHLPDITVLTPIFLQSSSKNSTKPLEPILFFAARGHHADIGSISPGSMPHNSQLLCQEGVIIPSFKVVKGCLNGGTPLFDEEGLTALFTAPGSCGHPECVGTRSLSDNINDLRAQIAANTRGARLMKELIQTHGCNKVISYMFHIQNTAEQSSRDLLRMTAKKHYLRHGVGNGRDKKFNLKNDEIKLPEIVKLDTSIDYMDDGTAIALTISINTITGDTIFDFTGTGSHVLGNTNAPLSVVRSAVIYSLRTLITTNIPLNQGILFPITILIPPNTLLSPADDLGVVGGNVLTSQRITDVILYAFKIANSSGCMNNFTFGAKQRFGYYETICGGIGATENVNGASGVHCHMTNTQITDSEVLERKFPVLLRRFQLRENSGGNGVHTGGNGVVREVQFLDNLQVTILSERRALAPNGMNGGENGQRGQNFKVEYLNYSTKDEKNIFENNNDGCDYNYDLDDKDKRIVSLGGKNSFQATSNGRYGIRILTPGGGGWGTQCHHNEGDDHHHNINNFIDEKNCNHDCVDHDEKGQELLQQANRDTTIIGSIAMFQHTQDTQ